MLDASPSIGKPRLNKNFTTRYEYLFELTCILRAMTNIYSYKNVIYVHLRLRCPNWEIYIFYLP